MCEVKHCPCGFTCYMRGWNFGYEFCPQCKVRLLPDGTTGPTYAELEARIAELENQIAAIKQAAISQMTYNDDDEARPCVICGICKHDCENVLECFSNSMGNWQPPEGGN